MENLKKSNNFKIAFKNFFAKVIPTLSQMGKAFLLPIALLPIAGLFLGIGRTITGNVESGFWYYFGDVMGNIGDISFKNLPILFAVAVAISFTNDSGVAGLTAIIGFLVFNIIQKSLLIENFDENNISKGTYSMLFYKEIAESQLTQNLGIKSLNTGVFGAICIGIISAWSYKKFYKVQLPSWIGFFSGTRLVPIITLFAVIPMSFIFIIIWPPIGTGLTFLGNESAKLPIGLDSFFHQLISRSLVPFGLHHVFNNVLWYSQAGGDLVDVLSNAPVGWETYSGYSAEQILSIAKETNPVGDQTILFWVLENQKYINFNDLDNLGMNIGRFLSGKYTFMLLGLPLASLAMWSALPKENRKKVLGIYLSSAMCCLLTGITEPIEYTFLFVAPWLFYGIHVPLAAFACMFTGWLHVHAGSVVSAGLIDFIIYGLIPWNLGTNVVHILWLAPLFGGIYFSTFYFLTKWRKIDIPGMNNIDNQKLFTKEDVKSKKNTNSVKDKALKIIEFLGGSENILIVDSCASRLRVNVKDQEKVDSEGIMSLGGCRGIFKKNNYIQAVYGGEQEVLKPYIKEILANQIESIEKNE